jgi:hypothetical protein
VAIINIVQAQVEEMYFIFNLEYMHVTLSGRIPHGLPTKSQCSTQPKNPSEMSETQWPHTLHISLNPKKKSNVPISQTGASGLGCNDYILNFGCSDFKTRSSSFYCLVPND